MRLWHLKIIGWSFCCLATRSSPMFIGSGWWLIRGEICTGYKDYGLFWTVVTNSEGDTKAVTATHLKVSEMPVWLVLTLSVQSLVWRRWLLFFSLKRKMKPCFLKRILKQHYNVQSQRYTPLNHAHSPVPYLLKFATLRSLSAPSLMVYTYFNESDIMISVECCDIIHLYFRLSAKEEGIFYFRNLLQFY